MSVGRTRTFVGLLAGGVVVLGGCANVQTNSVARTDGAVLASAPVDHVPTFYADALPILLQNCVACHQPDGPKVGGLTAPMSLIAYEDARPWASRIKRALETGYMPPWGAHAQHEGTFKDERYIPDADKQTLIAWVDAGALAGDPADARALGGSRRGRRGTAERNHPATLGLVDRRSGSRRGVLGAGLCGR